MKKSKNSSSKSGIGANSDLSKLFEVASKIKSEQPDVKARRQRWDAMPTLVKNALKYNGAEEMKLRSSNFASRLESAHARKNRGNMLYKSGAYSAAMDEYNSAVNLFWWCEKIRSAEGDDLVEKNSLWTDRQHTTDSIAALNTNAHERKMGLLLTFHCLANLSACAIQCKLWSEASEINSILMFTLLERYYFGQSNRSDLQSDDVADELYLADLPLALLTKVFYRFLLTYEQQDEVSFPLEYLSALQLRQPARISEIFADRQLAATMQRMRNEHKKRQQREKETFGGMFARGTLSPENDSKSNDEHTEESKGSNGDAGKASTKDFLKKFARNFPSKPGSGLPSSDDSDAELARMYAEAQRFGLDLSDERIQTELDRLQKLQLAGVDPMAEWKKEEDQHRKYNAERKRSVRDLYEEAVEQIPLQHKLVSKSQFSLWGLESQQIMAMFMIAALVYYVFFCSYAPTYHPYQAATSQGNAAAAHVSAPHATFIQSPTHTHIHNVHDHPTVFANTAAAKEDADESDFDGFGSDKEDEEEDAFDLSAEPMS